MFSRDNKHYRATPRTVQQAFGPYARMSTTKPTRWDWFSVVCFGVIIGLLIGWRG